jgi:pilus assembly protein CpaF
VTGDAAARHALGPLASLLDDDTVDEIMVNGPGPVWVERHGRVEQVNVTVDRPAIGHLIERVVAPLGLRADRSAPLVDARLPDGSRFNAVLPPLAVDGPYVTIRRFGGSTLPLERFCETAVAGLLRRLVASRCNIVVCGATSSGKTALLNALAEVIAPTERVVTIEDAAELRLGGCQVVRREARPANAEGAGGVDIRALLRNALRMRPDRIVIGEVRDGAAFDLLQALNTGHDGSLSTCHANGPLDALSRLETMALMGDVALPLAAVRRQLVAAVDVLVHVARGHGGARAVRQVVEVEPDLVRGGPAVNRLVEGSEIVGRPRRAARWVP